MSSLKKLSNIFKEFDFWTAVFYIIDQGLLRVESRFRLYFYDLMVQPIPDSHMVPANFSKSFSVREIPENDPALDLMPPPKPVLSSRFRQGAICLGAFQNDELAGYLWIIMPAYDEDEVRCTFEPLPVGKCVFDFDLYVFPKHRFGVAFLALWDGANDYLRKRGIQFTTSRVSRFNLDSIKAHNHLGWRCEGHTLVIAGKHFQWLMATVPPFFNISFSESSRPKLQINTET